MQLMELHLYLNNIARCLGIVVLLYERIQYHQFKNIIKCYTFLQVDYTQITPKASFIQSTLQAQPNIYFPSCIPPQTRDPALQHPLIPQHLVCLLLNNRM